MRIQSHVAIALVAMGALTGCAPSRPANVRSVAEAAQLRATIHGGDVVALAPQVVARADAALKSAREAETRGDSTSAELHADHSLALYQQAVALARIARASKEDAAASEALARALEQGARYATQRKAIDHEADELEKKLRVAREAQLPPGSGPTTPERERARAIAAQSLVTQAHLLCGAARLVAAYADGLPEAELAVKSLEAQLAGPKASVALDPAARARAACLGALTKARRSAASAGDQADALLGELSQSVDPKATKRGFDIDPARDERGVVMTVRNAFTGEKLTTEAEASVKDLGRVAAAHPSFAMQIVLHDAAPPGPNETRTNQKRGESVLQALVAGGLSAVKAKVEQAGARAPVVDPNDRARKDRNARLEIVFVSSGT